jgi:hypothetical protein
LPFPGRLLWSTKGASSSLLVATSENSIESYHAHTPPQIQAEINLIEDDVRVLGHFVTDKEVRVDISSWVSNTGGIRYRKSHYLNTIEIYCKMKLTLG